MEDGVPVAVASAVRAPLASVVDALTLRAISCAITLGSIVCFANMYFGLQAGTVNAMPMQTALLGFAFFRSIQQRLSKSLSAAETTVIEVVAGAIGLAPFTSGFTAFIPALEFLTTPAENGPVHFNLPQLLFWSMATCALGVVVAGPFRPLFILQERLRYPSATATGTLIGVLFGNETIVARAQQSEPHVPGSHRLEGDMPFDPASRQGVDRRLSSSSTDSNAGLGEGAVGNAVKVLLISLAGSLSFSLIAYLMPILRHVPIFGPTAAKRWLWAFDLSPAYFGYGIIIGPSINAYILVGAILGWGILSPVAKHKKWAPGPVDDWDNGSRGWILWVGMGLILGDSAVGLGWAIFKPLLPWARRQFRSRLLERPRNQDLGEHDPLLPNGQSAPRKDNVVRPAEDDDWPTTSQATPRLLLWTGAILLLLYFVCLLGPFRTWVSIPAIFFALLFLPLGAFVSMRSLGETDNGAALAIGRVAQFILGLIVPASSPVHISANLLLGGVIETGASQSSQHMGGLKTAYMTKTAPRAIFYSQLIGSFAGTLVATFVYRIYTSTKKLPSDEFGMPDAHLWLVAARLIYQQGLPPRAFDFAIGAFVLGAAFSILRILGTKRWWRDLVPSGVALAIGMYIVPALTLPRALGSLILVIGRSRYGIESFVFMCSATGLILGQGIFSLVALIFDAVRGPHF